MKRKIKIINIIQHCPPYEWYKNNKPDIHWDSEDGKWVGIWDHDIAAQIGVAVTKRTSEFEYEVWHPDHHAKRIYEHTFENGIKHIHFPAEYFYKWYGLKRIQQIRSKALFEQLYKEADNNIIIHLNSIFDNISKQVLNKFPKVPKVINFHNKITSIPIQQMFTFRRNILANFYYLHLHFILKKNRSIYYTYNNSRYIDKLRIYPQIGIKRSFTAINFDDYTIASRNLAKQKLNIPADTYVFTLSSRFDPIKQIDRIISIFCEIEKIKDYNFKLLITGHGEQLYEDYLYEIGKTLTTSNKLVFTGYLRNEPLSNVYQATDLFISSALTEGGPTTVIKAIAYSIPVFLTRVGGVDDFFIESDTPKVMDIKDYSGWKSYFIDVLEKRVELKTFDRIKAKNLFDWDKTAGDYVEIYKRLSQCYEQ